MNTFDLRKRRVVAACGIAISVMFIGGNHAVANTSIKIGLLEDSSGVMGPAGIPKVNAVRLAVEEVNKNGGILGRQVELVYYDTQSDTVKSQQFARRLIKKDKVDVLMGGYTSSAREAIRPVANQEKTIYFYNNDYEGGVCDSYTFITGPVPEMQWKESIPWMMNQYGGSVYYIGADYNFGQIQYDWVKRYTEENGGIIVGKELIPLNVTQYDQTIRNIEAIKPDFIVTEMVGANQVGFYLQKSHSGNRTPMISSLAIANEHEHTRFDPPVMEGMHVPANFVDELDTDAANAFVNAMRTRFPEEEYAGQVAVNSYNAIFLYKEAVEKAQSVKVEDVINALESGDICVSGPNGRQCIDGKTHHSSMPIYMARIDGAHDVVIEDQWDMKPDWLASVGCDLVKSDLSKQFTLE